MFNQVWRIEDNVLQSVDNKWLGHFYGGDCYLILYKYEVNYRRHYILYVWQVRFSSGPLGMETHPPRIYSISFRSNLNELIMK